MSIRDTWRLGFVMAGYTYPCPNKEALKDPIEHLKWHMEFTKKMGGGVVQFPMPSYPYNWKQKDLDDIKELMSKLDIELELGGAIYGVAMGLPDGSLFDSRRKEILASLEPQLKAAKYLGVKIIRGAYGRLKIQYSRFNKNYPLNDHIKWVTDNLKEAAKIFEDHDLYYAQENHLDFYGKEFAKIYAEVGSRHIGCTLDTANAFTLYVDPDEENRLLAPYTFTVHAKDLLVQDFTSDYGLIPFQPRGCAVGDGSIDIPGALNALEAESPFADGLHIVIEQGWTNYDNVTGDKEEYLRGLVHKGLDYLKAQLGRSK
jgi:sugar phosphate isomerase/epimerase